ncbi:hypothetical protein AB0F91_00690 [Amycolatopsis sp. NPDC023774]|uniref:hypothetical protein n=1 Tax=Amycolatopsis sp. NPDC023774 TaxID=3155015 RepID=UPI0033F9A13D
MSTTIFVDRVGALHVRVLRGFEDERAVDAAGPVQVRAQRAGFLSAPEQPHASFAHLLVQTRDLAVRR